ncbi:uncharacterized protein BJX67DRAFT_385776 [Aspergillus lucknowensis]|uniref:Uncharacterized protein n=1 Tax=Aspergillus lucknowensis TaxID=176173 RepID=A0ABR4LCM1_9EURO
MPSVSTAFEWTFTNWGPLTTPYSLPDTCTSRVAIANSEVPSVVAWWNPCEDQPWSCFPTPTASDAIDDIVSSNETPGLGRLGPYFSPAPSCPSGWETVAAAARTGDPEAPLSTSGWIATRSIGDESEPDAPRFHDLIEALAGSLDPSETVIMCCPSSMTVFANANCYSALPSYTPSTACRSYFVPTDIATVTTGYVGLDGETTTSGILMLTPTTPADTWRTTFAASETADFVAYTEALALLLLHQPTDLEGGTDDGSDHGSDEADDPSETNSAGRLAVGGVAGLWGVVGGVIASVLAGASLVLLR